MCLSFAIHRPDDVLAKGEHAGYQWQVIHNRSGYRCGYVRVPAGHPWHGKDDSEIDADVHGGLTFAEGDEPCPLDGPDDGYWVGFDCAHSEDAPDPSLPSPKVAVNIARIFLEGLSSGGTVRTQEYVEAECRSLCEQAATAAK